MRRTLCRVVARLGPLVCLLLLATMPVKGQLGAKNGEWRTYGGDIGSTHYSPLDQINAGNFNWTDGRDARVLYVTPGYRLVALDAKTGIPAAGFGKSGVVDLKENDDQPAPQTGSPMTHTMNGKQYVVVAIAGANYSAELVAFRLPS
jgi:glucose dehydrogenase